MSENTKPVDRYKEYRESIARFEGFLKGKIVTRGDAVNVLCAARAYIAVMDGLLATLEEVLDAFCGAMSSEYDFPGSPWESRPNATRDKARALIERIRRP